MCEKCIVEAAEETEYTSATVRVNIGFADKQRRLGSPSLSGIQRVRLVKENEGGIFGKETPGKYYFRFNLFSCIIIPINMMFHSYSKTNSV